MRGLKAKIFLIVALLGSIALVTMSVAQEINYIIMLAIGTEEEEKTNLSPVENQGLSAEVLALKPIVERIAKEMGGSEEVPYLLTIIMVESGGRGGDPFQSSESAGLPPNSITDPEQSIRQGIIHYKSVLQLAKQYGIEDRKAALQAYNYGGGFLSWLHANNRPYTFDAGVEFARQQANGLKVPYTNPIASSHGNWRYAYGNMFYAELVYQYVNSMQQGIANGGNGASLAVLESVLGQELYGGECYMLTAYYVEKLGGPQLRGSGFEYAERIGEDYDWPAYGWSVIINPKPSDLRAGDIVNWYAGGILTPQIWGHTGVIASVSDGGQSFTTYEQNSEKGRIVAKYNRTYSITKIRSIVRKNK